MLIFFFLLTRFVKFVLSINKKPMIFRLRAIKEKSPDMALREI